MASDDHDIRESIDAIWRIESARLIASLARIVHGDVGLAEEFAQDALVAALEQWPTSGVPEKPGAWLMSIAKRRAIDHIRRNRMLDRTHDTLARQREADRDDPVERLDTSLDNPIGDDLLRLVFMTCHPILAPEARVALTLRLLGGMTTDEIARAFLVPEPTIAQRIVRAKRTLAEKQVPFDVPRGEELRERLASVLAVIYLIFNEGYSATAGEDWIRPSLCEDALRLGRIIAEMIPQEPEVHGLIGLMEIQASRLRARVSTTGEPILLLDQNRAKWDFVLIRRGLAALDRAQRLGDESGPYCLQASIAACHARARTADETDWRRIVELYEQLAQLSPSPIVELNRAVAVSMADGPDAALKIVDRLARDGALANYHLLPSVRGDLLFKLGRFDEARVEFERAASQTQNARERKLLLDRARSCSS